MEDVVGLPAGLQLAWYRFRATFRQQWGGYLAIVVLVGAVGGLALGSIAAARRTASSFSVYWASTNPPDLVGVTGVLNPSIKSGSGYNARVLRKIAGLRDVKDVTSQSGIDFLPLQRDGDPLNAPNFYSPAAGNGYGSVDGANFDVLKVSVVKGRRADVDRADEMMLSASGASELGVHVGSVLPIGIYTNSQTQLPAFGTAKVKPYRVIDEHIVGIFVFPSTIIEDDADAVGSPNNLFTPALTQRLLGCCVNYTQTYIQVTGGPANYARVTNEIAAILPGFPPFENAQTGVLSKAQRAIKPEGIALGVFGGIVGLATLLLTGQLLGRRLQLQSDERAVLSALGAGPAATTTDGLIGIVGAVVIGALISGAVAVGLSCLAPLGPVRFVYPEPGANFDWTVLGLGMVVFVVALGAIAAAIGYRGAPHRSARRIRGARERRSRTVSLAGAAGLPAPAITGIRFAIDPGAGREAVPVRSAIFGAMVAVIAIVATVTFGASLNALVSHPALYGWNWDYALVSGGDIPQHQVTELLDRDRYVAQWSGIYTGNLSIDGINVPVLGERPGSSVAPPILTGHDLERNDQIVLAAGTLAQLGTHVGATVDLDNGSAKPVRLTVVGTATMPTLGSNGGPHLEMGTGAIVPSGLIPALDRNPFDDPLTGPNAILVRVRGGFARGIELASLEKIAAATTHTANFGDMVTGVLHPAEIVNYRALGATPVYLGAGLGAAAIGALALTLVASVRRRNRDLALLKTLGFTGRQLAAAVAWQSSVSVAVGTIIGCPLGIVLGRWLWALFARNISAVPTPTVPVLWIVVVVIGAIVVANVVAAVPGRLAARTPTALLLRSE